MFKQFIFILMLLILTACGGKDPVIGVENQITNGGQKAEVKLHYFDSKKEAENYYHEKGITDYALMNNPNEDEKKLFDRLAVEEKDGVKTVIFIGEDGAHADDVAFEFIFEDLGLGTICIYDGKECKE